MTIPSYIYQEGSRYLPMDRRHALARGEALPDRTEGATLFADISGFTPLTEALVNSLGPQRGAEELPRHLNLVYDALITEVQRYRGCVIGFSGDAITCWFDGDPGVRATTCALAMQAAMRPFAEVEVPGSGTVELAMKAAIATGAVRRFLVGDPEVQYIDVLAGQTLDRVAAAEQHASKGEVLLDPQSAAALGEAIEVEEWRDGYAVVSRMTALVLPEPWPPLDMDSLSEAEIRPWLLAPVYERIHAGQGEFLAELRPAVALFLRFGGIDYDHDEAAGQKLDDYIRRVQSILSYYEGALIQVTMGDKGSYLYIAFGAPIAHEDDALRAVAAAVELRDLPESMDFIHDVQIGISRGRMRTGAYGGSERRTYGVLGDEVNLAARLMSQAQPGQILVSQRIVYATRQRYLFHPLGLVSVKGKQEPVPVALLLDQRRSSLQRPSTLFSQPLVGREEELARLEKILQTANAGVGQIARLEGAAGVGKSHLTAELVERALALDMQMVLGSSQRTTQGTPYTPWRQVFRALLGLSEEPGIGEEPATWSARQIAQVRSILLRVNPEWRLRLPLLGDLLGLPIPDNATTAVFDPPTRQNALFALVVEMLQTWSKRHPLLMVLEDVHWMDETSLALTLTVARALVRYPILLLLVHRPQTREEMPILAALSRLRYHHHLPVTDLSPEGIAALVRQRLSGLPTPLALDLIQVRAQGNPFFTEELVDALRESGALRRRDDGLWDLSEPLTQTLLEANCLSREHAQAEWVLAPYAHLSTVELGLPDSVHGVVLSRLDRLPEAHKLTLKVASVIGRTFALSILAHAHPLGLSPTDLGEQIDHVASRDFVRLETPSPHVTYLFKHNITQEVAYGTLLYDQRRRLHRSVAEWYEQNFAPSNGQSNGRSSLAPHYPILVHHWHHAEEEAHERHYAILAGHQAAAQFANEEAIGYLSRALVLTPEEALEERYALLLAREAVHHLRGAREPQAQDLAALEALAEALGDEERQATVALRRAIFADVTGEFPAALDAAQQAVNLAVEAGNVRLEMEGYNRWGWVLVHQANFLTATELFERALAMASSANHAQGKGDTLCGLGQIYWYQGSFAAAKERTNQALALYEAEGDHRGEARCLNMLGFISVAGGDKLAAQAYFERGLSLYYLVGERQGEAAILNNLGNIALLLHDYEAAHSYHEQALTIRREIDDRLSETKGLVNLGRVAVAVGDYAAAREHAEQAVTLAREIGSRNVEAIALVGLSASAHGLGDDAAAREYAEQAVTLAQEIGARQDQGYGLLHLGRALLGLGDYAEATRIYEQCISLYRELGQPATAMEYQANLALAELRLGQEEQSLAHIEEVVAWLESEGEEGMDDPMELYLSCYQVLSALAGREAERLEQAHLFLRQAHTLVQERAARISSEPLRIQFLEAVGNHRTILSAWEKVVSEFS